MSDEDDESVLFKAQRRVKNPMTRLITTFGRPHWRWLAIGLVGSIVGPLLDLIPAYILGVAIDQLLGGGQVMLPFIPQQYLPTDETSQLFLLGGIIVSSFTAARIIRAIRSYAWTMFSQSVQRDLRTATFDKAQRLELAFFDNENTGELLSILNNDVNELSDFLSGWVGVVVTTGIRVLGITIVMLSLNWQLTLVALAPTPLVAYVAYRYRSVIGPKYEAVRSSVGELNSRINNSISGLPIVKAYTGEDKELADIQEFSEGYRDAQITATKTRLRYIPLLVFLVDSGFTVVFIAGSYWVLVGPPFGFTQPLSIGVFVTFMFYSRRLTGPIAQFGRLFDTYQDSRASGLRVFGLLDTPIQIDDNPETAVTTPIDGSVSYKNVSFSYDDEPVLKNISFDVPDGATVGIVGPTGAGKSTLMKLLLRLYEPDAGSITVDGVEVDEYALSTLRSDTGYVSQDAFLFDGTVLENILYGNRSGTKTTAVEAAKKAGAHEFINDFEDAYETQVGERGKKLSGGQRQRIALARALVSDPAIMILDEATSHVDTRTEAAIQSNISEIRNERTTFMIAHRLSTVRNADIILVLEDGELVEQGKHDALVAADGLYAELWDQQTRGVT